MDMTSKMSMTILSVDDNPLMAEVIGRIIESDGAMRHDGHYLSGDGVREAVTRTHPSVVVMDLEMPGTNTFSLIEDLTKIAPESRIIILSGHLRKNDILRCIDAGAVGYIHKERSSAYIADAIRRASNGEFVLCEEAAQVAGLL